MEPGKGLRGDIHRVAEQVTNRIKLDIPSWWPQEHPSLLDHALALSEDLSKREMNFMEIHCRNCGKCRVTKDSLRKRIAKIKTEEDRHLFFTEIHEQVSRSPGITSSQLGLFQLAAKLMEREGVSAFQKLCELYGKEVAFLLLVVRLRRELPAGPDIDKRVGKFLRDAGLIRE